MDIFQTWRSPLIFFTAISCALSAGIFYAFSTFVMQALAEQPSASGIATMQSINITVINPLFMAAFFLPAIASILLIISVLRQWDQPGAIYLLVGSICYLIGTIGVTVAGNIPLNDALAIVQPDSLEGATFWTRFLTDWTFWNHVRTIAALMASVFFVAAH